MEIKVPDIGDFKNVEIIEILVKEGQSIEKNDPLITLERYNLLSTQLMKFLTEMK